MFCYNKKGLTIPYDKQTTELMHVHCTLSALDTVFLYRSLFL